MADTTKEISIIISAKDEASRTLSSVGSAFSDLINSSKAASFAFVGSMGVMGKSIIDIASDMEQAKVGFTTMLGSADQATKTLSDLSNFAKKTPFTFPSIVEASQRLLAYNVEAKNLIPTLSTLGNIASGVGMDKMPQLVLAFGQVKAATKLTGMELRQFSEAGVPLLQALVDQANKAGGVLTTVGGTSQKTRDKIESLNETLAKQNNRLVEMQTAGKTSSATYKNLEISINNTKDKLSDLGTVSSGVTKRVKVTAEQMKDMITEGKISFEQVQQALQGIGGEQGKWGDLMEKQSQTFSGRMSNIQDQLIRVGLNIAGISTETKTFGEIIKGGPFDLLSTAIKNVLNFLNQLEPNIKTIFTEFTQNIPLIAASVGALAGALLPAAIAMVGFLAPIITLMAIGAGLGVLINEIIGWMGGMQNVVKIATDTWNFLATGFQILVLPMLKLLAYTVQQELIPELQKLWNEIGPVAIPLLQILAGILGGMVFAAINLIIGIIIVLARAFTFLSEVVRGAIDLVKGIITGFKDSAKLDFEAILKFVDALSGGWVTRFESMRSAISWVVDALSSLMRKAEELGSKVAKGLKIPGFQHGGFVPGSYGQAVPAILHGGERVIPRNGVDAAQGGGGSNSNVTVNISGSFNIDSQERVSELAQKIIEMIGRQNELAGKGVAI